ncbi:hypothetical protein A2316_01425 [Candidatus Falkowbacteria bacterium RIFOXYB2_FULL_38_15]|uniref:CxxC-x17-CxxC domain-containing protein n=1 Tax=Candidatus Falkowbacteria bacterium RIFOXYA2_FULL_38_12 TaxID=1797993 RepID=A0A1F5S198_9BACT|nr:MAG: hypothetical protein A2257_03855 [Candidatus Falkowbacteria bacterium RIFOXYA2_FULL_38_12]OGF32899.1 MAG: hypothetical protein A2316_01425 [Candidatus Falkowbacteria bacterium RIFOXYB2_FULL_38_15]OGF44147.1 MAG: hypothetical protein A2555_02040 [Candidatus Falkowbacteria bacterium RIFOXYD2_FULL_39_16]
MGNFGRNEKRSGGGFGRSFGGGKRFGGGGRSPAMHQATCSECGASCELPFRPTGDRPVFCSNCFGKQQDNAGPRPNRFSDDRRERPRFEDKRMYDATCSKCGNSCQIPFRPTGDRPVFCSNCFGKQDGAGKSQDEGKILEQIKVLNTKLDKILEKLAPAILAEKSETKDKSDNANVEAKKEVKDKEDKKEKKEKKTKTVAKKSSAKK